MSQSIRQSELFTGADWQVLYRAFTDVNFNASDPPSINAALRAYIQQNYPENFNDWIESSEFVAIIDLLSWLAGTLAFKTDLNAREAFLDTAETRQAVLRLARFVSYNPRRNQCGQGIVKIVKIQTDDDVYDGFGTNLNNVPITWNNPDDPDWYERFVLIMNDAFLPTNPFGVPLKTGTVGTIATQGYRLNNVIADGSLGFSASVAGNTMDFELVNADFDDGGGFYERTPDPTTAFNLFYLNDGNGFSSATSGFFLMFKQGTSANTLFNIATPVENNVLPIGVSNINDSDVWVQTVNDSGQVLITWSKVPAIFSENITYNNYDPSIRNIFSVITQQNDQISIRFSDGRFGAVPVGNIRVTYRTSNGLLYQIRPADLNQISTVIPYYNSAGVKHNLTVTYSLQSSVTNSVPAETDAQIKARAPAVYATQNRMVSGQDYNTFPYQSNLAVKLKALNRVYSGHSRFIDLNDPTGNYQDVNVFSDDGIFFSELYPLFTSIPANLNPTASDIVNLYLQPLLNRQEVTNYVNNYLLTQTQTSAAGIVWNQALTDASFGTSGYFSVSNPYLVEGAFVQFQPPAGASPIWATIASITGGITQAPPTGTAGPVTLSLIIPTGSTIIQVIPSYSSGLDSNITAIAISQITQNQSFTLWFDYSPNTGATRWLINPASPTNTQFQVATITYVSGGQWNITSNGSRYVFESLSNVQWYDDGRRTTDAQTGTIESDLVRIMKVNENLAPSANGRALGINYDMDVDRIYLNRDGSANPRRVTLTYSDTNLTGYADKPDTFVKVLDPNFVNTYLFWQHDDTYGDSPLASTVVMFFQEADRHANTLPQGTIAFQINGATSIYNNTFWVQTDPAGADSGWQLQPLGTYSYGIGRGANVAATYYGPGQQPVSLTPPDSLMFLWKHYASTDVRIDPARTNINDIFVLSTGYDYLTRLWIANGADPTQIPPAPTELDLRIAFADYENYRMFSDAITWRPATYKFLFGPGADDQLQATFKVVQLPNSTLSAGEVQSAVIAAINQYFDVSLWDFGETFYFTPLAAYIHQQLAVDVASVVLVPNFVNSTFGDNFEIRCRSDEIFISTAQVAQVQIISSNTPSQLRIS